MKLVASLIVRNELGRYLPACLDHLLAFCDEIRVLDDGSTDGTGDYLMTRVKDGVRPLIMDGSGFYTHEGRARQKLLDWTLKGNPTHVLTIDADEFVADGKNLRLIIERTPTIGDQAWTMCMQEIWAADPGVLQVRQDGGWVEHEVVTVWCADKVSGHLRVMPDKALASGRVPDGARRLARRSACVGIFHFGWANVPERQARYQRYVTHDNGRFHQSSHLQSIMWQDGRVKLTDRSWPDGLLPWRDQILGHAGVKS